MHHPERRLLICVDMERYSRRSNLQQYEAQKEFPNLLQGAASAVGLDRMTWSTQQAGDGELAILPRDVPESRVIGRFVPELNRRLRAYNLSRVDAARIRLRIAVHQGLVHLDGANGFPGSAVVFVCRLCDAGPVKRALAAFPDAGVALVVSTEIFRDVVSEYPEEMRPERFRRVRVSHADKEFEESAWVCVVDEDLSSMPLDGDDRTDRASRTERSSSTSTGRPASRSSGSVGPGGGGIRTGDIWVNGPNAIGTNATAIGSVGRDAVFGRDGDQR
ncbi:hypothetical protein [Micromonospora eburnea]|uniref:Uncharacterized protein n=1 Tax=Micromonospora eburnea TaxID=227316 RepID=A0A1C6U6Y4_9ACTN|nr:hypothetical protein [Micromonospora eburnea]SCL49830.1 hypothetical protein GA0070604_1994 [Micromonospora eburnea]